MQTIEARTGEPVETTLARLYVRGMSQQAIADELGVSRLSVIRWMRAFGLLTRRPGEKVA